MVVSRPPLGGDRQLFVDRDGQIVECPKVPSTAEHANQNADITRSLSNTHLGGHLRRPFESIEANLNDDGVVT